MVPRRCGSHCLFRGPPANERTCRPRSDDLASRRPHGTGKVINARARAMAVRTESRVKIAGSVREVWAYLCDVGRWPEWAPGVLECRVRGGAPLQPGARVEQRAR